LEQYFLVNFSQVSNQRTGPRIASDRSKGGSPSPEPKWSPVCLQFDLSGQSAIGHGLSGEDTTQDTPDIDFYVQHFDQPIESAKMEAIKMLIEQEAKKQKTSAIQKKAAVAPAMEA